MADACAGMPLGISSRITSSIGVAMTDEKVRENRLRRMLERRGLTLTKSRRRDPEALGFGHYAILEAGGEIVADQLGGLDHLEAWLAANSRQPNGITKRAPQKRRRGK